MSLSFITLVIAVLSLLVSLGSAIALVSVARGVKSTFSAPPVQIDHTLKLHGSAEQLVDELAKRRKRQRMQSYFPAQ